MATLPAYVLLPAMLVGERAIASNGKLAFMPAEAGPRERRHNPSWLN